MSDSTICDTSDNICGGVQNGMKLISHIFKSAWIILKYLQRGMHKIIFEKQYWPMLQIGPRAGAIYSRLFEYTQQHTTGFTREQLGPGSP
jgi:hypothetical protein